MPRPTGSDGALFFLSPSPETLGFETTPADTRHIGATGLGFEVGFHFDHLKLTNPAFLDLGTRANMSFGRIQAKGRLTGTATANHRATRRTMSHKDSFLERTKRKQPSRLRAGLYLLEAI